MKQGCLKWLVASALVSALVPAPGQEPVIDVRAGQPIQRVSRYLTGACIEDVNHEVYGGIDSQMIFGESFDEPAPARPLRGFRTYGGRWTPADDGSVLVEGGDGPKVVGEEMTLGDGEVSVDLRFAQGGGGNGGLILRVNDADPARDQFNGYEISLESGGTLVLGRHRQNWEPIRRVPCSVPLDEWITLTVRMSGAVLEVLVNGQLLTRYEDQEHPLSAGGVGLRAWQRAVRFRHLIVNSSQQRREFAFAAAPSAGLGGEVSGMWRAVQHGTVTGDYSLLKPGVFDCRQRQRLEFTGGAGELGVENQGLNRWGMNFVRGKRYEGYVWVRAQSATEFYVALESRGGERVYAEQRLRARGGDWERLDFSLVPEQADRHGRWAVKLKQPGAIDLGYALLQPGSWGRFRRLPVRRDVAEALIGQGITVLRQGGSMVNAPEYRWKKMIGPRAARPPYLGTWYPHASNGWGIFEFLDFCRAAGFLAVPDVNLDETASDLADLVEYANGSVDSPWGRRRAANGHPRPYGLTHLEIGNEEKVDAGYWEKFKLIAEAVWAKDPKLILVVGDFAYGRPIQDPSHFTGAASGITNLAAHRLILGLARQHQREVWFDVHIGTEGPRPDFGGTFSFVDALERLAQGARHRVVIFEFNAGNHSQRRALANAAAILAVERDGRLPVATSANCLQPDGQNDNDWNQGLLFLNPAQVWLQPPGYVTQMVFRNYEPWLVHCEVQNGAGSLKAAALLSEDHRALVLQVVNPGPNPIQATIQLQGFLPRRTNARLEQLAGPLEACNTAAEPNQLRPQLGEWRHGAPEGPMRREFPAQSFTVIRFR